MRMTSAGPIGLGSTYSERRVILGFETRLTATVTEWDPPHSGTVTMEGRPFRSLVSRFTLADGVDGTLLTANDEFELRPALRLLWPIIGPFLKRRRNAALRDLKTMLEADRPPARG